MTTTVLGEARGDSECVGWNRAGDETGWKEVGVQRVERLIPLTSSRRACDDAGRPDSEGGTKEDRALEQN